VSRLIPKNTVFWHEHLSGNQMGVNFNNKLYKLNKIMALGQMPYYILVNKVVDQRWDYRAEKFVGRSHWNILIKKWVTPKEHLRWGECKSTPKQSTLWTKYEPKSSVSVSDLYGVYLTKEYHDKIKDIEEFNKSRIKWLKGLKLATWKLKKRRDLYSIVDGLIREASVDTARLPKAHMWKDGSRWTPVTFDGDPAIFFDTLEEAQNYINTKKSEKELSL